MAATDRARGRRARAHVPRVDRHDERHDRRLRALLRDLPGLGAPARRLSGPRAVRTGPARESTRARARAAGRLTWGSPHEPATATALRPRSLHSVPRYRPGDLHARRLAATGHLPVVRGQRALHPGPRRPGRPEERLAADLQRPDLPL